jgi:hypothetical protein
LIRDANDRTNWVDNFLKPGYHQFCLNSPYLDKLLRQMTKSCATTTRRHFPRHRRGAYLSLSHLPRASAGGGQRIPLNPAHVRELGEQTYANYTRRVRETVDAVKPGLPVFHNGGHIPQGRRDLAAMNTHLELEACRPRVGGTTISLSRRGTFRTSGSTSSA